MKFVTITRMVRFKDRPPTSSMRVFSYSVALLIALGLLTQSVEARYFSDTSGNRYDSAIQDLAAKGVIQGYSNGTFQPTRLLNRAELMKILIFARYPDETPDSLTCFKDIPSATIWYARPVCVGKKLGIVQGYPDGSFGAVQAVNLIEALKMTMETFSIHADAAGTGQWFEPYVNAARSRGILPDLLNTPTHLLTRGEMAELINRIMKHTPASSSSRSSSSINSSASGTLYHAIMNITQQTSPIVTSVPAGKKNVSLLKFNAVSDRQDVLLTGVVFKATQGALQYAQNFRLLLDSDNNGSFETVVATAGAPSGNRLNFSGFAGGGVKLIQQTVQSFEVQADLAPTYSSATFAIGFAVDQPSYVTAQGAIDGRGLDGIETNGVCPALTICWTKVDTITGTQVNINERGNLFVTALPEVHSHQVLAGSISDPLLKLRFRADQEDTEIEIVRFEGGNDSIDALLLYKGTDQSPFAQATQTQCGTVTSARFCSHLPGNVFVVNGNQEMTIIIRARMKNDQQGAVSGQSFALTLASSTASNPAVEARGITSMQTLAQNNNDTTLKGEVLIGTAVAGANATITGPTNDIVFAKIGTITNADQRSNGSPVPVGQSDIAKFKIATLANVNSLQGANDVLINTLTFTVSAINMQFDASSFKLALTDDPSHTVACTGGQSTGTFSVTCPLTGSIVQNRIAQGSFATFVLTANVTNPQTTGHSALVVSLQNLGDRTKTSDLNWSDENTTFTWVDVDQTAVDSVTFNS